VQALWACLRTRKKYWLLPMVGVLLLFGVLLAIGGSSVDVFVYTLF
jgi:hypothetical protein